MSNSGSMSSTCRSPVNLISRAGGQHMYHLTTKGWVGHHPQICVFPQITYFILIQINLVTLDQLTFKTLSLMNSKNNNAAKSWGKEGHWSGEVHTPYQLDRVSACQNSTDSWYPGQFEWNRKCFFFAFWIIALQAFEQEMSSCIFTIFSPRCSFFDCFDQSLIFQGKQRKDIQENVWHLALELNWEQWKSFLPSLLADLVSEARDLLSFTALTENQGCKKHFDGTRPSVLLLA